MNDVYETIDRRRERSIEDLRSFLRQPSISAQGVGLEDCARLLANLMRQAGIDTQIFPMPGVGPIVVGQVRQAESLKTLVCYGHYDVQPPEPLDHWTSPPFSADVRDGKIFARGATDDKGSLFASVKAVEAWLERRGALPVNLVMVFEGEEEIGSSQFGGWVLEHLDLFEGADGMYGLDGNCDRFTGYPRMFLWGSAEIIYVELRLRTGKKDVWAGEASLVPNAAWRLAWALATLKDENERILIDGWYDDYIPAPEEDVAFFAQLPFDENKIQEFFGMDHLLRDRKGAEAYRAWFYEPTCTISGFHSGYAGPGSKTIVPAEAVAKVDFRLRPNQVPQKQFALLKSHLQRHGFGDIEVVSLAADARPAGFERVRTPPTWRKASIVQAMQAAARRMFGVQPILIGGAPQPPSGPTPVEQFGPQVLRPAGNAAMRLLGIPDARGWMGDRDSNQHAPNEFISIEAYMRAIKIAATILDEFARREV